MKTPRELAAGIGRFISGGSEVRLESPWSGASAWARVLADGRLELELYDHSPEAQSSMGNDVAWIWTVAAADRGRVVRALEEFTGFVIGDDRGLLEALGARFDHVHAVRDWIRSVGVVVEERFDGWA